MRLAVATHTLARIGGVEAYVEQSVRGLIDRGHEVRVFSEDSDANEGDELRVPAWTSSEGAGRGLADAVRAYAPEVVLTHGLSDPAIEASLAAMHPSVFFAHAYHGTCIAGAKTHSFPTVHACARTFGRGCLLRYYPRRCGGLSAATMVRQYRRHQRHLAAVREHDWLFAISEHIAAEYARHGVPLTRIRVLPPPVPSSDGTTAAIDPNHVVYIGRLELLKGPLVVIAAVIAAAATLSRPLRLTIAGTGAASADVRHAVSRIPPLALGHVRLVGRLSREDCADLLASAGLLVVPSLWPEPFGLIGYEAAAHGVPAAAFRVGGIPEWLLDGVSGHLADPLPDPVSSMRDAIVLALGDKRHYAALRRGAHAAHAAAAARDAVGALAGALEACSVNHGPQRRPLANHG
jgi:glycosyltransferase involved in cell wall biosynthesis